MSIPNEQYANSSLHRALRDDELLARIESLEGLSILVNNAGGNRSQPFVEVDAESLDFVIDLNVRSAFRVAQAAARSMLASGTQGCIIHSRRFRQFSDIGCALLCIVGRNCNKRRL